MLSPGSAAPGAVALLRGSKLDSKFYSIDTPLSVTFSLLGSAAPGAEGSAPQFDWVLRCLHGH